MSKIAIDARFLRKETAGLGRYTRGLISGLSKIDKANQYTVFITPDDEKDFIFSAPNIKKRVINVPHYSYAEQTIFLSALLKEKFDLVHFTNFNHPLLYRRPFVVTIHDLTMTFFQTGRKQQSRLRRLAYEAIMKHAVIASKAIIAVSDSTKNDVATHYSAINKEKIFVTYEAADEQFMVQDSKEILKIIEKYGIQFPYFFFVGQWRPHKNLIKMLTAFEKFIKKNPTYSLVIAGKYDSEFAQLKEAVDRYAFLYPNNIKILGFVPDEDLPKLFSGCSAFVFPSLSEGFGLPVIEAIACGAPVIASNLDVLKEILDDSALFVDANSEDELINAMETIIDFSVTENLRRKGLLRARGFTWEATAKATFNVYNKILSR